MFQGKIPQHKYYDATGNKVLKTMSKKSKRCKNI